MPRPDAIPRKILDLLNHNYPSVRLAGIDELERLLIVAKVVLYPAASQALTKLLSDGDGTVQRVAASALQRLEAERRESEEKERRGHAPQAQPFSPVAPSKPSAKPEADKPSAETLKVVYPLPPKPAEPERKKPPLSSSGETGGKSPSKQVIVFLAIVTILVVGGLIYLAKRSSKSPQPQPVPIAAVTPSPTVIAAPTVAETASTTPEVAAQAANGASSPIHTPASSQNVTIPIIVKDTTSFFWRIVLAGARKAGEDHGVKVPELGTKSADINGEIAILEHVVSSKPAAIVIAPTQFAALGKPIDAAAKKVIIIGIDSAADSQAFTSFVTTDNVHAGRVAADGLALAITAKYGRAEGEVALITAIDGFGLLDQRTKGFKEEISTKYPGLKLVADKVAADGQATTGLNIMTDLITAYPDLRGVFTSNLIMTQGAGQAIDENKIAGKIKLVGFDSDDKIANFLARGTIAALVEYQRSSDQSRDSARPRRRGQCGGDQRG